MRKGILLQKFHPLLHSRKTITIFGAIKLALFEQLANGIPIVVHMNRQQQYFCQEVPMNAHNTQRYLTVMILCLNTLALHPTGSTQSKK